MSMEAVKVPPITSIAQSEVNLVGGGTAGWWRWGGVGSGQVVYLHAAAARCTQHTYVRYMRCAPRAYTSSFVAVCELTSCRWPCIMPLALHHAAGPA